MKELKAEEYKKIEDIMCKGDRHLTTLRFYYRLNKFLKVHCT